MTELEGATADPLWLSADVCRVVDLAGICDSTTDPADYPFAAEVVDGAVVYDVEHLRSEVLGNPPATRRLQGEWVSAMLDGPGLVVLRSAFPDLDLLGRATAAFEALITAQRAAGAVAGDHFAKPGANDRVWNALEKLALAEPAVFVEYYANDALAAICEAWLGPAYQVTSQINVVNPGGAAQDPHPDYHLGFQSVEIAERYPEHVHRLSPLLTLQGAVAHCDMPIESGPTCYLPYSQRYRLGYLAWRRPEFRDYFWEHHVQLPLAAGDAVFFNPSLFHAAGHNRSAAIKRMANLLQISSAYGRAMEHLDRRAMCTAIYPALLAAGRVGADQAGLFRALAAAAEGYAFPTNLDRDQPIDGLAPPSQADLVRDALAADSPPETLAASLAAHAARRATS